MSGEKMASAHLDISRLRRKRSSVLAKLLENAAAKAGRVVVHDEDGTFREL